MNKNEASLPVIGKLLENLNKWQRGENDGAKIGRGERNEIGWDRFLHGQIVKEMHKVLPCAGSEASNNPVKARRIVCILVQMVHAGAGAMWRTRCNRAAGSGDARIAIMKK